MSTFPRVFLSFAPQDANHRSLLIAATKAARLPVQFVEMPNHVTDDRSRHALSRATLQQCDVAMVLLSPHALTSLAVEADMRSVRAAGVPLFAVMAERRHGEVNPPEAWPVSALLARNWPEIRDCLQRLHPATADCVLAAG